MSGGFNTAAILGGVGQVQGIIPAQYQGTFASGVDLARQVTGPAPTQTAPPGANNSIAPGPAPAMPHGFADFMRSSTGKIVGVLAILGLGYYLYKGRA